MLLTTAKPRRPPADLGRDPEGVTARQVPTCREGRRPLGSSVPDAAARRRAGLEPTLAARRSAHDPGGVTARQVPTCREGRRPLGSSVPDAAARRRAGLAPRRPPAGLPAIPEG